MSWPLYTVEYIMIWLIGDTILSFAIQLAICLERKSQLVDDFQDCIGSNDHIDSISEVTYHFLLLFLGIRSIGVLLLLLFRQYALYYFCKLVLIELQEESVVGDDLLNTQTPSENFSGKVDR